jgi:hypothetical protein
MKYMFLIYSPEDAWTPDEWLQCVVKSSGICYELAAKQQFLGAAPLHPVATATTVRVRDGQRLITTGPFAETTEQLGGYYIIDVDDLDQAIEIAGRLPPARKGTVEIRPLFPLEGLPGEKSYAERLGVEPTLKQFMFLCYDDEEAWQNLGEAAHHAAMREAVALTHQLDQLGRYLSASPLRPSTTATSVRVRHDQRLVTDGPFAETREVLGGYYLILAHSQEEAVQIASQHSGARVGAVEVREVVDIPAITNRQANEILSSRDLPFTPDQVFAAFSDGSRLARWWGPAGFRNTFHTFEFRDGGQWRFIMHGPNGIDYDNDSVFRSITPQQIVFDHLCEPIFRMTMTLNELPFGQTRIVWRCALKNAEVRNKIATFAVPANEQNFDRLTEELRRLA